jgi:hypothetical protein
MVWHGYPSPFESFLDVSMIERRLDHEVLGELIEHSNGRPKDQR